MNQRPTGELTPAEREAFERLRNSVHTPPNFETDLLGTLKSQGLLQESLSRPQNFRNLYWLAAACVAAVVGFLVGRSYPYPQDTPINTMNQYALFLHEDSTFSGTDIPAIIAEYSDWAETLHNQGHLTAAEKLSDDIYHFGSPTAPRPSVPVSGYFIIQAIDLGEAKKIAESHPHLKYNGGIELRPIEKTE